VPFYKWGRGYWCEWHGWGRSRCFWLRHVSFLDVSPVHPLPLLGSPHSLWHQCLPGTFSEGCVPIPWRQEVTRWGACALFVWQTTSWWCDGEDLAVWWVWNVCKKLRRFFLGSCFPWGDSCWGKRHGLPAWLGHLWPWVGKPPLLPKGKDLSSSPWDPLRCCKAWGFIPKGLGCPAPPTQSCVTWTTSPFSFQGFSRCPLSVHLPAEAVGVWVLWWSCN